MYLPKRHFKKKIGLRLVLLFFYTGFLLLSFFYRPTMIDVVYILGSDSPFFDEELRYSMRSLHVFAGEQIGKVILVGEKPQWISDSVIHLPFVESGNKEYRIASKILAACESGLISDRFLFMNDDFFFTQHFDAANYPYYQKGPLLIGNPVNAYQEHLAITRNYLESIGKRTLHFDVHCPIIYEVEKFKALKPHIEDSKKSIGMVVKSLYCNFHGITGPAYFDVKIHSLKDESDFRKAFLHTCFSISDAGWLNGVSSFLQKTFITPSPWEKSL